MKLGTFIIYLCAISVNLCVLVRDPAASTDALWPLKIRGRHRALYERGRLMKAKGIVDEA